MIVRKYEIFVCIPDDRYIKLTDEETKAIDEAFCRLGIIHALEECAIEAVESEPVLAGAAVIGDLGD